MASNRPYLLYRLNAFTLLWLAALAVLGYLVLTWQFDKNYLGIVERRTHVLTVQEPGRIHRLVVEVGDAVSKDQWLGMLDVSDLESQLRRLSTELRALKKLENAHRTRYAIEVQRLGLQLENEAAALMDRLSLIESKTTELALLDQEIERLKSAKEAGLGQSRDMALLVREREALATLLHEMGKDLVDKRHKYEEARRTRGLLEGAERDSLAKSLMLEQMAYAEELERTMLAIEHHLSLRTLISPCEGYVTEVHYRVGDVVQPFDTLLCIGETHPRFLTLYLPEKTRVEPYVGMKVRVYSLRRRGLHTMGEVVFVHPGFERADPRLSFQRQVFWARKVRVALPEGHGLVPGEVVNVRLKRKWFPLHLLERTSGMHRGWAGTTSALTPRPIQVPESIREKTRLEPSGLAWVPSQGKFLVVSDDTGFPGEKHDHAPFLFWLDPEGAIDPKPLPIRGIASINDLEAITAIDPNTLILVSSQNISKKGKRPHDREWILKVRIHKEEAVVHAAFPLLSSLVEVMPPEDLATLGLREVSADGLPRLNIEGAAYQDGTLYLGLKEPVTNQGALLWRIDEVESAFRTGRLRPSQVSLAATIPLDTVHGRQAGFSDLTISLSGAMWALSTLPDVEPEIQRGGLYRFRRFADGRYEAERLRVFEGLKPEGLAFDGEGRLMIVFDCGHDIPLYVRLDSEAL